MKSCPVCLAGMLGEMPVATGDVLYHRCSECGFVQMDRSCRLDESAEQARYELHENSRDDPGYAAWLNRFLDYALAGQ